MPKKVAVQGGINAETSKAKLPADSNKTGAWEFQGFTEKLSEKILVNNKKVVLSATGEWKYIGGTAGSPSAAVPVVTDIATIEASTTKLTDGGKGVLVDGDKAEGDEDVGNKINISASQDILKTD